MTRQRFIEGYKGRGYLHFDAPFPHPGAAWEYVTAFRGGKEHSFHPFIGFTLSTNRIRRQRQPGSPRRNWPISVRPKKRPIRIASHHDAAIYSFYGMLLGEHYETRLKNRGLEAVPTAFRKSREGRSNIHHAKEVFDYIEAHRPCVALAFDVEHFFDNLSHQLLKYQWADLLDQDRLPPDHHRVFKSLTNYSWVSRKRVYQAFGISESNPKLSGSPYPRTRICSGTEFREGIREAGLLQFNPFPDRGIPQGAPMSAVLSNIYMLPFDEAVSNWAAHSGGLYRRYCDDIILVLPPDRADEGEVLVNTQIQGRWLSINPEKTERVEFDSAPGSLARHSKQLSYLGFTFDGIDVRLRQSSLDRYYGKMRRGVRFAVRCQKKRQRTCPKAPLKVRKLHLRYSYLATSQRGEPTERRRNLKGYKLRRTNFITYGLKAATLLNSIKIRRQLRSHWKNLQKQIASKRLD